MKPEERKRRRAMRRLTDDVFQRYRIWHEESNLFGVDMLEAILLGVIDLIWYLDALPKPKPKSNDQE